MKRLLIRMLVGTGESQQLRYAYGRMAGIAGILVNVVICILEFSVGWTIESIAMMSDAVHTLADAGGALLTLISFKLSGMKADAEHPHGHGRMEYLFSIGFSLVLFAVSIQLGAEAFERIRNPIHVTFSYAALGIMVSAMLMKLWLSRFLTSLGKEIDSPILEANGKESLADVGSTFAIAVGLIVGEISGLYIDGYLGAVVAVLIAWAGFQILSEGINRAIGYEPPKERIKEIKEFVASYPEVLGVHDLRIHDYGPGHEYASIHVEVDAGMGSMKSHELLDRIEKEIKKALGIDLTTHMDPIEQSERIQSWKERLMTIARAYHDKAEVHDVRMQEDDDHGVLEFLVVVPFENAPDGVEVRKVMTACVHAIRPDIEVRMRYSKAN